VLFLAASGIVDVWRNGSIFADYRAFMEDKADEPGAAFSVENPETRSGEDGTLPFPNIPEDDGEPLPLPMRVLDKLLPRFIAELFTCSFCFSHHTPYVLALLFFFPAQFVSAAWIVFLLKLPVYSLAATRLGTIVNALLPANARYDR